jgi:deazaflavin-dependent oxidoreductase (nitroreductase family)
MPPTDQAAPARHGLISRAIFAVAATHAGAWLFARLLRPVDMFVLRLSGQRTTLTAALAGLPIITVDSIGAKSGALRRVLLVGLPRPAGAYAVIASNFGQQHNPAWYANLRAHPRVEALVHGARKRFVAREVDRGSAEYAAIWAQATDTYPGYVRYKVTAGERHIPVIVLEPEVSPV